MRISIMVLTAAIALPVHANAEADAPPLDNDAVKASCAAEWPDDFNMQKYCGDNRREGHASYVKSLAASGPGTGVERAVLDACFDEWRDKWEMTAYCARNNIQDAAKLLATLESLPSDIAQQVGRKCLTKWPLSHSMQAYCAEKQAESWRALNN